MNEFEVRLVGGPVACRQSGAAAPLMEAVNISCVMSSQTLPASYTGFPFISVGVVA